MLATPVLPGAVVLDSKDILQADATVIAGILILVSILYAMSPAQNRSIEEFFKSRRALANATELVIFFFSFSAITIILGSMVVEPTQRFLLIGKITMVGGLIALIFEMAYLISPMVRKLRFFRGHGGDDEKVKK